MDCPLALVVSSTGKQHIRQKTCITVREDKWEKYLQAFPQATVYVENAQLASLMRTRFPRRKINLLSSLQREIGEEVQKYLLPELSSLVLTYTQEREVFIREWGGEGDDEGEFSNPTGITALPSGEIVVTHTSNHRIQVFTAEGDFLRMWGNEGSEPGEFNEPRGITTLPSGEIAVADAYNHRIQVFTPKGKFLRTWGKGGKGKGEFIQPNGISAFYTPDASCSSYKVVVADIWNHRVQVFTSEGKFLRMWGKEGKEAGEFNSPQGVTAFRSSSGSSVEIAVVDSGNHRIQVFTPEGKFLRMWGERGHEAGEFVYPDGITALPSGEIAVTDTDNHRIQVFSPEGKFLRMWGKSGIEPGDLSQPSDVTVLPSGEIAVVDQDDCRVRIYQTILD